jgi:hypothetical protein
MSEPILNCPAQSDTGAYRLDWSGPDGSIFRLVESENGGEEQALYEGHDAASTVSGRPQGIYAYRLGVVGSAGVNWSEPCEVSVDPPSLGLSLLVFTLGFMICVATAVTIIRGHKAHRAGEIG